MTKEKDNITRRLDKLYEAIESGKVSLDDLAPTIKELRNRQEQLLIWRNEFEIALTNRKAEVPDIGNIKGYVDDLKQTLSEGSLIDRKAFIRSFVKEIVLSGNQMRLSYTLPLALEVLTEETATVLPIVRYGGRFWTRTRDPSLIRTVL